MRGYGLGVSFQPGQNGGGPQGPVGSRPAPIQTAIRLISARLPSVVRGRPIAPPELLESPGLTSPGRPSPGRSVTPPRIIPADVPSQGGGRSTPGQGEWAGLDLTRDLGGGWVDQYGNTHPWDVGTPESFPRSSPPPDSDRQRISDSDQQMAFGVAGQPEWLRRLFTMGVPRA